MRAMSSDSGDATGLRQADPAARRRTRLLAAVATIGGAVALMAIDRYRMPLRDWILADPGQAAQRVAMLVLFLALILLLPLLALAVGLWTIATRTAGTQQFPPSGLRLVRDTHVVTGSAAKARGRQLKLLAVCCAIAAAAAGALLWRLASSMISAVS